MDDDRGPLRRRHSGRGRAVPEASPIDLLLSWVIRASWVIRGLIRGLGEPYAVAHRGEVLQAMPSMDWDDYLRTEAAMYRQLAEEAESSFGKQELLDLAAVCEEVANSIEDRLTGG